MCADCLKDGEDFETEISRAKFEELSKHHFDKIIPVIKDCLRDANVTHID